MYAPRALSPHCTARATLIDITITGVCSEDPAQATGHSTEPRTQRHAPPHMVAELVDNYGGTEGGEVACEQGLPGLSSTPSLPDYVTLAKEFHASASFFA